MALTVDQVLRERRFIAAHPEWSIRSFDHGSRFIASCVDHDDPVEATSLRELLDTLEDLTGGES